MFRETKDKQKMTDNLSLQEVLSIIGSSLAIVT